MKNDVTIAIPLTIDELAFVQKLLTKVITVSTTATTLSPKKKEHNMKRLHIALGIYNKISRLALQKPSSYATTITNGDQRASRAQGGTSRIRKPE